MKSTSKYQNLIKFLCFIWFSNSQREAHALLVRHGNILVGHANNYGGVFKNQINEYVNIEYLQERHQNFRDIKLGHGPKSFGNHCSNVYNWHISYIFPVADCMF